MKAGSFGTPLRLVVVAVVVTVGLTTNADFEIRGQYHVEVKQ